jgi:hypothetical protein
VQFFENFVIFSTLIDSFVRNGKVNTHNCRIWCSENPLASLGHINDSPKVNVFCSHSKERVYGLFFFFIATTITGIVCLDRLQQFLILQLDEARFPGRFVGRAASIG